MYTLISLRLFLFYCQKTSLTKVMNRKQTHSTCTGNTFHNLLPILKCWVQARYYHFYLQPPDEQFVMVVSFFMVNSGLFIILVDLTSFGPGVPACATRGGGRSEAGHCFHLLFSSFFLFSSSPPSTFHQLRGISRA